MVIWWIYVVDLTFRTPTEPRCGPQKSRQVEGGKQLEIVFFFNMVGSNRRERALDEEVVVVVVAADRINYADVHVLYPPVTE